MINAFNFISFFNTKYIPLKTIADVAPITPKKALYAGHLSVTGKDIFNMRVDYWRDFKLIIDRRDSLVRFEIQNLKIVSKYKINNNYNYDWKCYLEWMKIKNKIKKNITIN